MTPADQGPDPGPGNYGFPIAHVRVLPEHVPLSWAIEKMTLLADLQLLAEGMLVLTQPGEILDPVRLGPDIVWCRLLVRLAEMDLDVARGVALRVREHLIDVYLQADVHVVVMAVMQLAVAGVELLRGDVDEAAGWRRAAAVCIEDGGPELLRATEMRAERLLGM
jgi:hypothetical protein